MLGDGVAVEAPRQVVLGGCLVDIGLEHLLKWKEKKQCLNCDGTWCTLKWERRRRIDLRGGQDGASVVARGQLGSRVKMNDMDFTSEEKKTAPDCSGPTPLAKC